MIERNLDKLPIKEIYKDLFKPGLKKAGEALETVLDGANLILLPLKLLNSKSRVYFKKNMENYSKKLYKSDGLTSIKVPQYVGLPIIDKLTYLDQKELSEAFINLLTKASFDETLKLVHPTYISILNNLSADEAKILFHYKNTDRIPFIDVYIHRYVEKVEKPNFYGTKGPKSKEQLKMIIDYDFQNRENTFLKAAWNLTGIEKIIELYFPDNIDIYIENLLQNGLISFERSHYSSIEEEIYQDLTNNIYLELIESIKESRDDYEKGGFKIEFQIRKGYIEFTELGKGFISACIKEIDNSK